MRRKPQKKQHPAVAFLRQHARMVLGLLLLAVLVHDVFGEHGLLAMRHTQKEIGQLQQEIQQLNAENAKLADEVQALKSDPRMIERIAREEMNLARPNELIFKMPPKTDEDPKPGPPK